MLKAEVRTKIFSRMKSPTGRMAVAAGASSVLGAALMPTLAWFLTPEDVGRFNLLMTYAGLAVVLFGLGLDQAFMRNYYRVSNVPKLYCRSLAMPAVLMAAATGIVLIERPSSVSWLAFGVSSMTIGNGLILASISSLLYRFAGVKLRMMESAGLYLLHQVFPKICLFGVVGVALLNGFQASFTSAIWAFALSTLAASAIPRLVRDDGRRSSDGRRADPVPSLQSLLRYAMPLAVSSLAYWWVASSAVIALRIGGGLRDVALYSLAVSFGMPAAIVQVVLSSVWPPMVYRWKEAMARSRLPILQEYVSRITLLIFLVLGTFSWLAGFVVPSEYAGVQYLIPAAAAPILWYALSEVTAVGLHLRYRTSWLAFASGAASGVSALVTFPLALTMGPSGALVGTMAAYMALLGVRTEASARVWFPVTRSKMYLRVGLMVFLAIATMVLGPTLGPSTFVIFGVILVSMSGWWIVNLGPSQTLGPTLSMKGLNSHEEA